MRQHLQGSCSYGILNPDTYPYWTVAALSPANQFAMAGPSEGCGQCFEIQCLNSGGEFAVSIFNFIFTYEHLRMNPCTS